MKGSTAKDEGGSGRFGRRLTGGGEGKKDEEEEDEEKREEGDTGL